MFLCLTVLSYYDYRNMRHAPDLADPKDMEAHLNSISGDQLYVYEGVDAMRYVTEEDGSRFVQVMVRWQGFPLSEATWEDPISAGMCTEAGLSGFIAGLLDVTGEEGKFICDL